MVGVANAAGQAYTPTDVQVTVNNASGTGQLSTIITAGPDEGQHHAGLCLWPQSNEDSTQPFQTEQLTDVNGNPVCGLIFMPGNLANWLTTTFGGAAAGIYRLRRGIKPVNNTIYFQWAPSISQTQTSPYQTGVVLSDPASDLTGFNQGLSIVSAVPVYVESDLNNTQDPQRAPQDPDHPYPPLSVFWL